MRKVFLDTNVVIDFLAVRKDFVVDAARIMSLAYKGMISVSASAMTFSTASYVLARHHANSNEDIRLTISDFIRICHVTVVDENSVMFAVKGLFSDFEDAMQYESASKAGCEIIVTRNADDFVSSEIPVMSPKEFLNRFEHKSL